MTDRRTTGSARATSGAPAPARRRRPAQGARYLVTGISASAVLGGITAFGIADLRAAQAEPSSPSVPSDAGAVATAPAAASAPPSTPAPIIKIVIRRAGDQPSAPSAAAAQSATIGATVPPAPAAPVSPSPTPAAAAPARPAPAPPAPVAPAQSRSKAS